MWRFGKNSNRKLFGTNKLLFFQNKLTSPLYRVSFMVYSSGLAPKKQILESSQNYKNNIKEVDVARDILNKNKFAFVTEKIQNDQRFRITKKEFEKMCAEAEFTGQECESYLQSLHQVGLALHVPTAPDYVYLKPREVTRELYRLLDPDGAVAKSMVAAKAHDLQELEREYAKMKAVKDEIDSLAKKSAMRRTWATIGLLVLQGGVMARLIWWDLSWDVMEPVAYLIGFSYMTFG